jgi:acetyl-CoA carboxylase carboxyltransferase component
MTALASLPVPEVTSIVSKSFSASVAAVLSMIVFQHAETKVSIKRSSISLMSIA